MLRFINLLVVGVVALILSTGFVLAAEFNILPSSGQLGLNKDFTVNIKIDTNDEAINAAQAKISFNSQVLQVKNLSKDGSVFNFWLQEPEYSNTDGLVQFIAGSTSGVSGASLQVIKITFTTKGVGSGDISFVDGAITTSDGNGTNILANSNGAKYTISSTSGQSVGTSTTNSGGTSVPAPISTPIQIQREAIKASGLPTTPVINIPLYPDTSKWYNLVSGFNASWSLPADVSDIATAFNQNPNYNVPGKSEGLFESKSFPEIAEDGVYYFHARFKNNIGWGPTAHHRIALDTQPPLAFKLGVDSGLSSDEPSPRLSFQTGDVLSGIQSYVVTVSGEQPTVLTSKDLSPTASASFTSKKQQLKILDTGVGYLNIRGEPKVSAVIVGKAYPGEVYEYLDQSSDNWYKLASGWVTGQYIQLISSDNQTDPESDFLPASEYKLLPHAPGMYTISVKAVDGAGNSVEDKVQLEILPIRSPDITSITKEIIIGSDTYFDIKGIAVENGYVVVTIKDKSGFLVTQSEVATNPLGEWKFNFNQNLRSGRYLVTVVSKDYRGALSLPTEPVQIIYKDKPIIVLGNVEITLKGLIFILVIIGLSGAGYYWRKIILHIARAHRETIIITRDIKNAFAVVGESLNKYSTISNKKQASKEEKDKELARVRDSLDKIEKYVSKDIGNIE